MQKKINFSGLSFEAGQSKMGLQLSSQKARSYFDSLNLRGLEFIDHEDTKEDVMQPLFKFFSEQDLLKVDMSHYEIAYNKTKKLLTSPLPLVNWGGDHSISLSTVGAFTAAYAQGYVVWIDAHADINLPSKSMTGNLHGMPLSLLLNLEGTAGRCLQWLEQTLAPEKLIYIGLRDIDPFELKVIQKFNIKCFSYKNILRDGIDSVAEEIKTIIKGSDVHISFDVDSVDPRFAPSTGVPVKQGLTPHELSVLCQKAFSSANIRSTDIVEINPCLGSEKQVEKTYQVAFAFLEELFNYNIIGDTHDDLGKRDKRNSNIKMEWSL